MAFSTPAPPVRSGRSWESLQYGIEATLTFRCLINRTTLVPFVFKHATIPAVWCRFSGLASREDTVSLMLSVLFQCLPTPLQIRQQPIPFGDYL